MIHSSRVRNANPHIHKLLFRLHATQFKPFSVLLALMTAFSLFACETNQTLPTPIPQPTFMPVPTSTPRPAATPTPDPSVLVVEGERLADKLGCLGCYSTDGREFTGPSWKGVFGKTERLEGGGTVVVDEWYIMKSVRQPNAEIVDGFFDLMPAFGEDEVGDVEMVSIIAFIKSLQ